MLPERFYKARLVLEHCFDQLVDQIIRELGSPDRKIVHSDRDIVLIEKAVSSRRNRRKAEFRHRLADGFYLFGRRPENVTGSFASTSWIAGTGAPSVVMKASL